MNPYGPESERLPSKTYKFADSFAFPKDFELDLDKSVGDLIGGR